MARIALLASALTLVASAACSSESPVPPTIMSGVVGPPPSGKGIPHPDAASDAVVIPIPADASGPAQNVSCTYVVAGTTGAVCAIEVGVPVAEVSAYQTSCTSASYDGTPGITCSPDSLTGCCEYSATVTASFGSPSWVCDYPGDIEDQASCQSAGGTWSSTQP